MQKKNLKSKANSHNGQIDKFKEAAKEHGCDESEKAFDEKLKKVAKGKTDDKVR